MIYVLWILYINRKSCAQVHELVENHFGDNLESILFSWLHVYNAHFASVRYERV